jgi:membrane associated rhomboid family serine protease
MIPLKDEIKTRRVPVVNYALILINVAVFIYQFVNASQMEAIVSKYAMIPANVTAALTTENLRPIITSMFMHAGWVHLLGNMLYLWIFGDNVEDRLGHFGYLNFYLAGGFAAAALHILINPQSTVPTVGASGAIAAVLGAYLVLYPKARIYTFIPIGFWARLRLVPAAVVLGLWFLLQVFSGFATLDAGSDVGGTAFWAHIGGFVFGVLIGFLFKPRETPKPKYRQW